MELRDTCVYAHYRASDGLMFYIGIGSAGRPYEVGKRNPHWENVVRKHGYTVEVLLEGLSWSEACAVEVETIAAFRSDLMRSKAKLTNLTDGGEGPKGWSKDPRNAEWLRNVAEANRKMHADPRWRAKNAEAARKNATNAEWRANVVKGARKRSESPEWREAIRKRSDSPEWRANKAETARKTAQNPDWLARNAEVLRNKSPEWVANCAVAVRAAQTPEVLARRSVAAATRWASTPHSRLNPYRYDWLYVWKDGKVYAR